MSEKALNLTFWEHVNELRTVLIRSFATVFVATSLIFFFFPTFYQFLIAPLQNVKPENNIFKEEIRKERITNTSPLPLSFSFQPEKTKVAFLSDGSHFESDTSIVIEPYGFIELETTIFSHGLILITPLEGVMTTLSTSFWLATSLTSPIWGYFILLYVLPALKKTQKQIAIPFAVFSVFFLFLAICFAYLLFIPFVNEFLFFFNAKLGQNLWSVASYVQYTLLLCVSSCITFELVLILFFLVHFNKVNDHDLKRFRPIALLLIFVISAILTPPDIFTQIFLAIPLTFLYEGAILYSKLKRKKIPSTRFINSC